MIISKVDMFLLKKSNRISETAEASTNPITDLESSRQIT